MGQTQHLSTRYQTPGIKLILTLVPFTRNGKRSSRYPAKELFLTLAGIFNILIVKAFADENQEKEISNMPPKDSPYLDPTGAIIIPFSSDPKYHYWNGGQPLSATLAELNTTNEIWDNHTETPYPVNAV
jgi:hypothetical protein